MTKAELAKLQRLIDATVAASRAFNKANDALCEYCREHYGFEPADLDVDLIIDGVQGGCGLANGMTATEFDKAMIEGLP
jgi:hypothetical protein